jgi:N-acetylglucosaminyldiphosphoundecaprenol N-acetyl-beta-D-mannosaminyltransferase
MTFLKQQRYYLADRPVDPYTSRELALLFQQLVRSDQKRVLANLNLHGLYCSFKSDVMMDLLTDNKTIVHIDGMPIRWLCNFRGARLSPDYRTAHIDLIPELMRDCAKRGLRIFLVGSSEAGAADNAAAFRHLVPGLDIVCRHGFFDTKDTSPGSATDVLINEINSKKTNLLLVGMGMPLQEEWIAAIKDRINVNMIMPVGGFADYFTGRTRTPPRVLGRLGLEWLFRLLEQPRRLAFRYLGEPLLLLHLLALNALKGGKWGPERKPQQ